MAIATQQRPTAATRLESVDYAKDLVRGHVARVHASGQALDQTLTDLLADLMHFADDRGLSFTEILAAANEHYLAETGQQLPVEGPR